METIRLDLLRTDGAPTRRSFIKGVLFGAGVGAAIAVGATVESGRLLRKEGTQSMLSWGDEFNGPMGAPPDPSYWSAEVNGGGGGNRELQYYVPSANKLDGEGNLVITAVQNNGVYPAWYGPSEFVSGKIWTRGRLAFRYGHLEVRAAFPCAGKPGAWPAIWLLGANYGDVGWPACGEIDVFESFGKNLSVTQISAGVRSSAESKAQMRELSPARNAAEFHVYTLDWYPKFIEIGVDGSTYFSIQKDRYKTWPFSQPFFLILNLAIGGTMGGNVPSGIAMPYIAKIDYVRLYGGELYEANGLVG